MVGLTQEVVDRTKQKPNMDGLGKSREMTTHDMDGLGKSRDMTPQQMDEYMYQKYKEAL